MAILDCRFRIADCGEAEVDGNSKLQITNNKQITITEIQNSKPFHHLIKENSKSFLVIGILKLGTRPQGGESNRRADNFGNCDLFVMCDL